MLHRKVNAVFPLKTIIGKVMHINLEIPLISTPATTIVQLEEYKEVIAYIFGVCRAGKNKKSIKYLFCKIS